MASSWHQSGAFSPISPPRPSAGVYQQFSEPSRRNAAEREAEQGVQQSDSVWGCVPRVFIRVFYRIRNTLAIYNFFIIYCLNAFLNLEIYREYMSAGTGTVSMIVKKTWLERLYIATLLSPFMDMLARLIARNFLKLQLAKAMSHVSLPASLAITTPSLNTYALLLLRGNKKLIFTVLTLDILEILYSCLLWRQISLIHRGILWTKLFLLGWSLIMFCVDVAFLLHWRRFFKDLPPHLNPIYICWDINTSFHWSSPNSLFDALEAHEDLHSNKWTTAESKAIRRRIAEFNMGEEELASIGEEEEDHTPEDGDAGHTPANGDPSADGRMHEESEESDSALYHSEYQGLLPAGRSKVSSRPV